MESTAHKRTKFSTIKSRHPKHTFTPASAKQYTQPTPKYKTSFDNTIDGHVGSYRSLVGKDMSKK